MIAEEIRKAGQAILSAVQSNIPQNKLTLAELQKILAWLKKINGES
jgi:hypothetical protein